MPTIDWLKKEFSYGYRSGDVLAPVPDEHRRSEESRCGANYRNIFLEAVLPRIPSTATILELGPGAGSWSRAFLNAIPDCRLVTVDFQDVSGWLEPESWNGRLVCHKVEDASFSVVADGSIDVFFSFGVLCHNNASNILSILRNALPKMKPGGIAIHQHGDWRKLDAFGWESGGVPASFRDQPDESIWWPRNDGETMARLAREAGWDVLQTDLGLIERDGLVLLRAPSNRSGTDSPAMLLRHGMAQLERGEYAAALATAENAMQTGNVVENLHMLRAAALLHQGREEEGVAALRREIESFPGNAVAKETLAELLPESPPRRAPTPASGPAIFVNLGCGRRFHPGWRNLDIAPSHESVDRFDVRQPLPFADASVDFVYHSHLLEHLALDDARTFLRECFRILKPGGTIRMAVPDLEGICRRYLLEFDAAVRGDREAEIRKDWMALEMLDQVARHSSGGEMLRWWAQSPVPQEDFIVERNGDEAKEGIESAKRNPPAQRGEPTDPLEVGRFRLSGEAHRRMYDRLSLAKALLQAGFVTPRKVACTESAIPGFSSFLLDSDDQGRPRKPDSLFMEADR